ncbi:MAG TPA: flagellar basal body L-ring protein FlgH [Methylomirabilota bacterium]|nr:flagellar basal body L-ring protein FlgH [Methylomirabilota bacterium]
MMMRWRWLVIVFLVSSPIALSAQSLWTDQARSLYPDVRARQVNDILTILILEDSKSERSAQTKTSKDSSVEAGLNEFPKFMGLEKVLKKVFKLDFDAKSNFEGKGDINRSDKVTAQISARVVKVLENGAMLIEGRRAVAVNDEVQFLVLSGLVRSEDVTPDNTVKSTQIADAEIRMEGSGVLAEKQRPGILNRLLDWLWLF